MTTERYELAAERIRQIPKEEAVSLPFRRYFQSVSEFVLLLLDLKKMMENGSYGKQKRKNGTISCMQIYCRTSMKRVMRIRHMQ